MTGARVLTTVLSAATGACYAALAGLSISAMAFPVRRFQVFSIAILAVAVCLGYLAFRAATSGQTDDESVVASLSWGMFGALVGLVAIVALLLMFGPSTRSFLAHALGQPASSFTTSRLLVVSVLLGFGTGFVARSA